MGTCNFKGITDLPQGDSQQIISQYVDDTSFTVEAEEVSVDKFGTTSGLEINWQ